MMSSTIIASRCWSTMWKATRRHNFLDGWFLVDLDRNDEHFDLAIQELGPSAGLVCCFRH